MMNKVNFLWSLLLVGVGAIPGYAYAAGTLIVENFTGGMGQNFMGSTLANDKGGLLRVTVSRGNNKNFFSETIPLGGVFSKAELLETGDQIDFVSADNTSGPLLPSLVVRSKYGRPVNVTITCKPDQCTVSEN